MNRFLFTVHTDSYAGNFEREMAAWIFGAVDYQSERSSEKRLAEMIAEDASALKDVYSEEREGKLVYSREADEDWHGFAHLTGSGSESVLFIFQEELTSDELRVIQERAHSFPEALLESEIAGYQEQITIFKDHPQQVELYSRLMDEARQRERIKILGFDYQLEEIQVSRTDLSLPE